MANTRRLITHRTRSTSNDLKLALGRARTAAAAAAATVAQPARQPVKSSQTAPPAAAAVPVVLTARTVRLVDDIRVPFKAFSEGHALLEKGRQQLAPKFMRACAAWQEETSGTFVAFVQLLDPTVPADRDGYKAHTTYAAADYLRRLMGAAATRQGKGDSDGEKPASPVQVIAALLATMAPVVENMDAVWSAFETRLHWSSQRVKHLQQLVGQSPPLLAKAPHANKLRSVA